MKSVLILDLVRADQRSTLFWGGSTFAPSFTIPISEGGKKVNIQAYLQNAFLAAVEKLVEAVGDVDTVMGFEVGTAHCSADDYQLVNEPHPGFIGLSSIHGWVCCPSPTE